MSFMNPSQSFRTGMSYTGKIELDKKGELCAVFKPNAWSLLQSNVGEFLLALPRLVVGWRTTYTEAQLLDALPSPLPRICGGVMQPPATEQTVKALHDLRAEQAKRSAVPSGGARSL